MEEHLASIDSEQIYSKIIDKEFITFKLNQIVLGTKKLISNNANFKDYSKGYEEITKITTFKYPDEDVFPLLKNEELISLSRVKYSYDSRKNKSRKKPKLLSNRISLKKFKLSDKALESNDINKNSIKNINKYQAKNAEVNINKINTISSDDLDSPKNQKNSDKPIKLKNIYNQNLLSEESSTCKTKMKLDLEISSSIQSTKQQNNKTIFSPLSVSTMTQNSFFNKNKKTIDSKNNNSKSMNYYKNIMKNRNLFRLKNNLATFFNKKKNLYNNRILLRDILLQEKDYFNLKYEHDKVFLSMEQCHEYIKEQMAEIKKNKIKIKNPEKFEKFFENSKFGHPSLTLNSIVVEFQYRYSFDNNRNFNINEKQVFNIPFEYIPVFYFHNFGKIKEILISIFHLDDDLNEFHSKYENLSYILRASQEFKESEEYRDNKADVFKKEFIYKLQINHSQTLNKSNNFSFRNTKRGSGSNPKRDSLKSIDIYNTEYIFNSNPDYLRKFNKDKNLLNSKNIFEFLWLSPTNQYLVTLKTPEISFKINDVDIRKNIDIEFLFFLAKNNFQNWDFYVMEYLFSFYDFILIINSFFSLYKLKAKHRALSNIQNNNNVYKHNYQYHIIHLTKDKKVRYSKKNSKLEFIFTDNNLNNYIKILHNYKIFVFNKKINPHYQFCFHLNFIQMKSLFLASKKQGIKYLLEKIIIIDKDNMKIKLNYEYLDNFCKNDLNNLEPLLPSTIPIKGNKYKFNLNDTKFCLFYPIIETIKFDSDALRMNNCFISNLEQELKDDTNVNILDSLFKITDLYKWPSIIVFLDLKEKIRKQNRRATALFPILDNKDFFVGKKLDNTISSKKIEIFNINEKILK